MEYVSQKIMKILIEKGYNYPSHKDIYYHYLPDYINKSALDLASWYQCIDWIFEENKTLLIQELQINWLEFWYNTLIPELQDNKFVLEGFIGMLLNWFYKNKYLLSVNHYKDNWYQWFIQPYMISDIDGRIWLCPYNSDVNCSTLQQARHECILQCFKLLKENL